jgi:GMP synthase-like glutamine amidotransferase
MTIQIAIIDPFVKSPAHQCFNSLVSILNLRASYHMPSLNLDSLSSERHRSKAYIVLGSASHIHEKLPWHAPLADFLYEELKQGKPVLGCCFGHQLMAHRFGAEVNYYRPDEDKLTGARRIVISQDFWNYKKGEEFFLGVTHKQVVKKPPSELQEVGRGLPYDILIHKTLPFLGTQAHPEASDFFCESDIKNLSLDEKILIRRDGARFIQRFFEHFRLI